MVVKCSQVYWISQYNQKFTSPSTSYMTCTCIYRCICTNEKATFLTRELPKNRWTHNWLPLKHWPPCDIWHMIPQFRLLWYIIGIFLYLKTWYFKIAIKFWFSWLKKKLYQFTQFINIFWGAEWIRGYQDFSMVREVWSLILTLWPQIQ